MFAAGVKLGTALRSKEGFSASASPWPVGQGSTGVDVEIGAAKGDKKEEAEGLSENCLFHQTLLPMDIPLISHQKSVLGLTQ